MIQIPQENQAYPRGEAATPKRLTRSLVPFVAASLVAFGATEASAKLIKGPQIAVDETAAAPLDQESSNAAATHDAPTVERRRYEANIVAPIPLPILGGMFVVKADFFKERRIYAGDDDDESRFFAGNDRRNPNVAGWGAVFLPHASEGTPRFFAVAERYGAMSFMHGGKPMAEFVLGADFSTPDLPASMQSWLKFSPTDEAESRLLVRMRRYPGFVKWLYFIGHTIETQNGWSLDLAYPSQAIVGRQWQGGAWKLYGGARAVSREYPWNDGLRQGWTDGYVGTALIGARRQITGPLYASLEVGYAFETLDYRAESGDTVATWTTKWRPGARVAIESWIKNP